MLLGGDEIGREQQGNNNAYCRTARSRGSTGSTSTSRCSTSCSAGGAAAERSRAAPAKFFSGQAVHGSGRKDIAWFLPSGREVGDQEWFDDGQRSLGMILNGDEIPDRDPRGRRIRGGTLMVLLHAGRSRSTGPSRVAGRPVVGLRRHRRAGRDPVDPPPPRGRGDHRHGTVAAGAPPGLTLSRAGRAARRRSRRSSRSPWIASDLQPVRGSRGEITLHRGEPARSGAHVDVGGLGTLARSRSVCSAARRATVNSIRLQSARAGAAPTAA